MGPDAEQRAAPLSPRPSLLTALAFVAVAAPFAYLVLRLLLAPAAHVYLSDDLALIDLHTRRALRWQQQLGVFDRNNWNHPGPAYFYLLTLTYRVLGNGARALFVGATLLNAGAALACVGVVRRRTTPARALWAGVWIGVLAFVLAAVGPASITYSEAVLGALPSPWNPLVVIFPLLLLTLLCAGAMDRSPVSVAWALVVGSFVVQTNISALPLVATLVVVAAATWVVTAGSARWRPVGQGASVAPVEGAPAPVEGGRSPGPRWRPWAAGGAGILVLVLMWVPPVVQQLTNTPGNLGLIVRFFRQGLPGQGVHAALWSVAASFAVAVHGPGEVMGSFLGVSPRHAASAVVVTVATVVLGLVVAVVGYRQRRPFAAGLGALVVVGTAAVAVGASRIVGPPYGYLLVWSVVLPMAAVMAPGMLELARARGRHGARRPLTSATGLRVALCGVAVMVSVATLVRVAGIPTLGAASDPVVGELTDLVVPELPTGTGVVVTDEGAGVGADNLLDTERFIGLVNVLDERGYRPRVSPFWQVEFGPGYVVSGAEPRQVDLSTWVPSSPSLPGYVGRAGDMAVVVTDGKGRPVPG